MALTLKRFSQGCGPWLLLALAGLLAFDATNLDMTLARWFGHEGGFGLRDHPILSGAMYSEAKELAIYVIFSLGLNVLWPQGAFAHMTQRHRLAMFIQVLLVAVSVPALKQFSTTACPWDLQAFGGMQAYFSHWDLRQVNEPAGRCFPGGHAVTGFAFFPVVFALAAVDKRSAAFAFALVLCAGMAFGVVQQLRGAHFMSHTLWSGWLCCAFAWGLHALCVRMGWVFERASVSRLERGEASLAG